MSVGVRVGIVGGGISGLSCAYYLGKAGIEATVFDPAPGGPIGTVVVEGCILETGPESWLAAKPWAEQLIRELGLGDELTGSNDAKRRTYVLRRGSFVTLPEGLQMVVPTRALPVLKSELFGWHTKVRMGLEIYRNPKAMPDRSVAAFVEDHFGAEAVDYLAEPLLAGVFGGSPQELSAASVLPKFVEYEQRYGSVVVGTFREKRKAAGGPVFKSLRRGLGTLIEALRDRVQVVPERVDSIVRTENGWRIEANADWHEFDRIVLACGANRSVPLIAPVDDLLAELLSTIPYTGSSIWTFGYRREDIRHPLDAFGFLVPKAERGAVMACTWLGTKWPGRVPEDEAVFRCFSTDPDVTREASQAELHRLMGITAQPIFAVNHRWPDSMPQYTVGHSFRVADIEARAGEIPGLHIIGNAYNGIGIPDCVRNARQVAEAIQAAE
ncbi:MAG: protoporphyrinogen/coproporphyrinogen oxidase [Bryobacterales bacterium]|nr:protoporphyrinogen/coproporphyrinogen oxidase [Bryobacterales bacterium]